MSAVPLTVVAPEGLPVPPILGGAVQTWIAELAPRVAARRPVTVVSPAHPDLPATETDAAGVRHVRVRPHGPRAVLPRVVPDRDAWRFRLAGEAHLHAARGALRGTHGAVLVGNRAAFVPRLRALAPAARVLLRLDNLPLRDFDALARADAVLACSDFVARAARAAAPAAHAFGVANGVDTQRLRPAGPERRAAARAALGLGDGPVVLFVGRFVEDKGVHLLLEAVPQVLAAHPAARFVLCGSAHFGLASATDYERAVQARAEALGPAVTLAGFVPPARMADYWAAADVFCAPAVWAEPFGLVYLESMASGVPCVGTRRGGIPEVVQDGETGLLLAGDPGPDAVAGALVRLLGDAPLRERLGAAGRRRVLERFTWDTMADRVEHVLAD